MAAHRLARGLFCASCTEAPGLHEQRRKNRDAWRQEQAEVLRKIERHQNANRSYLEGGVRILELSQRHVSLYDRQKMSEKRRMVQIVFSNSAWKDGRLIPDYRKPFDMLGVTNESYQKEKAVSGSKKCISEIWLPFVDVLRTELATHPQQVCLSLVRPVS